MQSISLSNPIIKEIKSLKKKSYDNLIVLEGLSILALAYTGKIEIITFIYEDDYSYSNEALDIIDKYRKKAKNTYTISKKTFQIIKEKDNEVPLIAIVKYYPIDIENINIKNYHYILVLDGIELPGNLGTIYRSAYTSKVDLIINVDSTTDVTKPKFTSSSRGTLFHIDTVNTTYEKAQELLLKNNYRILLGEPKLGKSYYRYDYQGNIALVFGSERFGINPKWYQNKHEEIYIPMKGEINSLNVGIAASIILAESSNNRNIFN